MQKYYVLYWNFDLKMLICIIFHSFHSSSWKKKLQVNFFHQIFSAKSSTFLCFIIQFTLTVPKFFSLGAKVTSAHEISAKPAHLRQPLPPLDILRYYLPITPRLNEALGSIQWTNTFGPKILKYIMKIIKNANVPNLLASRKKVTS